MGMFVSDGEKYRRQEEEEYRRQAEVEYRCKYRRLSIYSIVGRGRRRKRRKRGKRSIHVHGSPLLNS